MKRILILITVLIFMAGLMPSAAWADQDADGFGFAVRTFVCFPEMAEINRLLVESGLDPLGDVLLGVGGGVVATRIGDLAMAASAWVFADSSRNVQAEAQLCAAVGGLDLRWVADRDDRSTLIAGAVLGSGTSLMSMSGYPHPTVTEPSDGLVPEPDRVLGVVTLLGCPYVEVNAKLAPWLSLEFRLGYALHAAVYESGDLIGLTRSALVLSGPMISGGVSIAVPGT